MSYEYAKKWLEETYPEFEKYDEPEYHMFSFREGKKNANDSELVILGYEEEPLLCADACFDKRWKCPVQIKLPANEKETKLLEKLFAWMVTDDGYKRCSNTFGCEMTYDDVQKWADGDLVLWSED
jgi:hypothetical protein